MSGKYALEGWLAAGVIVVEKTTLLSEFKGNRPRSSQPDLRLVHRRVRENCLTSERGASSSVVWRDSCQTPEREHDLVKPPPHPTIEPRSAMGQKKTFGSFDWLNASARREAFALPRSREIPGSVKSR